MEIIRHQHDEQGTVRDINAEHLAGLSTLERMAVYIAERVGTPGFFLIIAVWTVVWVLWNQLAPRPLRFDNGMEFAIWIFISNVIQICLMPLLLIAQNLQSRHDKLQAENDFAVMRQSEQAIEAVLGHLHLLNRDLQSVMAHLGMDVTQSTPSDRVPDVAEEEFAQRQQQLLDQMAQTLAQTHEKVLQHSLITPDRSPRKLPK